MIILNGFHKAEIIGGYVAGREHPHDEVLECIGISHNGGNLHVADEMVNHGNHAGQRAVHALVLLWEAGAGLVGDKSVSSLLRSLSWPMQKKTVELNC